MYLLLGLDANVKDGSGEEDNDETEFYAWNELRLHPLLMKAICKLGFKEPTPIQKACIPAAAHQGKVVRSFSPGCCFGFYPIKFNKILLCAFDRMLLGLQRQDLVKHWRLVCPFCNAFWRRETRMQTWLKNLKSILLKAF